MLSALRKRLALLLVPALLALGPLPSRAGEPLAEWGASRIRAAVESEPERLIAAIGNEKPSQQTRFAFEAVMRELAHVDPFAARGFLRKSIVDAGSEWSQTLALHLSQRSYADLNRWLGKDFEPIFRALAENPRNLDSLGRILFVEPMPWARLKQYLNIIEGKLYTVTIPLEERKRAADMLLFRIQGKEKLSLEALGLYDRLYDAELLRPYDAQAFLDKLLESADNKLKAHILKRQRLLDGVTKQAWKAPYKPIPGLPATTYQRHSTGTFVPLKDEFEGARRLQELSYPSRYTAERQRFQADLMREFLQEGKVSEYPRAVFTSGAMGSGKTTSLAQLEKDGYLPKGEFLIIDPDRIRERLPEYQELLGGRYSDYAAHLTQHEAMDIADMLLEKAMKDGKNVVFSTSMRDYDHYSRLVGRIRKTSPRYTLEMLKVDRAAEQILQGSQDLVGRGGRKTPLNLVVRSIIEVEETAERMEPWFDRVVRVNNSGAKPVVESLKNFPRPESGRVAHAFFDLDWTIVYPLPMPASHYRAEKGWKIVEAEGKAYRVAEHLDDLIQEFMHQPNLRMAIASGGTTARNVELLKNIRPPSLQGYSLYDFVEIVISNEDLRTGTGKGKGMDWLKRKAIDEPLMVTEDFALFDDQKGWLHQLGDRGAWTGRTYEYFATWEQAKAAIGDARYDQRYVPKTKAEWLADRNKLDRFRKIMADAAEKMKTSDKTFGELVRAETKKLNSGNFRCWLQSFKSAFSAQ